MSNDITITNDQFENLMQLVQSALSEAGVESERHEAEGIRGLTARAVQPDGTEVRVVLTASNEASAELREMSGVARRRIGQDTEARVPTLSVTPAERLRTAGMPTGAARDRVDEPPTAY